MKKYEFSLIVDDLNDNTVDVVYGKCPDASIGRSNGTTYVAFDREALSLDVAIESAVADLNRVGITPLRVEMDIPKPSMA
jgi:hypothetical protein